jgi:hypothetical protein
MVARLSVIGQLAPQAICREPSRSSILRQVARLLPTSMRAWFSTAYQVEARNPAVPALCATRPRSAGDYCQSAVPALVSARNH